MGIIAFLSTLGMSILTPILPAYIKQFGASTVALGSIVGAYAASWVVLQVFTGHLSDKWGRKKFIVLGLLIYGIFGILVGRARTIVELLLFRTLQGTGVSLFGAPALALVGELPGESRRKFGFYRSCQGIGFVAGPFLGGFLADLYNIQTPFYTTGVIGLFAAIIGWGILRETRGQTEEGISLRKTLKILSKHRSLHLLIVAVFLSEITYAGLDVLFPLTGEELGLSLTEIGLLFTSYMISFSLTQTPLGILSEKIGNHRIFLSLMAGGTAMLFILAIDVNSFNGMLLVSGGLGIVLGGIFTQSTALASDLVPSERKGIALALFDAFIDSTFVIAPVLISILIEYQGLDVAFLVCAVFNIGALIIIAGFLNSDYRGTSNPLS